MKSSIFIGLVVLSVVYGCAPKKVVVIEEIPPVKEVATEKFEITAGLRAENTIRDLKYRLIIDPIGSPYRKNLYEKKLVTYPRVDTVYLPKDQYPKIPGILKGLVHYSDLVNPLLQKPIKKSDKVFNDNKVTDHHAIIPTGVPATAINSDETAIYDLIARRFIAAFYPECLVSNTTVDAKVDKYNFKATGKQILDEGWRVVYANERKKEVKKEFEIDQFQMI